MCSYYDYGLEVEITMIFISLKPPSLGFIGINRNDKPQ